MKKAILVIFRHGETDYNAQHLMTGQRDIPLNEKGVEQAKEAGRLVAHIRFDKAYASKLSRAFNTAALALEASETHVHLRNDDGSWQIEQRAEINEVDTGDFTGRSHKTDPEIQAWKRDFNTPLPNGESDRDAVERVGDFYRNDVLPRLERGENVVIAVHAGIVRAFDIVLGFEDIPQQSAWTSKNRKRIPNATPRVVVFEDGVIVDTYHLENAKEGTPSNQNAPSSKPPKRGIG